MASDILYTSTDTPVGQILLGMDGAGLRFFRFQQGENPRAPEPGWRFVEDLPCDAVPQLRAYFAGELRQFDLPLAPEGTTFQLEVWAAVEEIPYGRTLSYAGRVEHRPVLGDGREPTPDDVARAIRLARRVSLMTAALAMVASR